MLVLIRYWRARYAVPSCCSKTLPSRITTVKRSIFGLARTRWTLTMNLIAFRCVAIMENLMRSSCHDHVLNTGGISAQGPRVNGTFPQDRRNPSDVTHGSLWVEASEMLWPSTTSVNLFSTTFHTTLCNSFNHLEIIDRVTRIKFSCTHSYIPYTSLIWAYRSFKSFQYQT